VTTSGGPGSDGPPRRRRWTWERPVGPRWLLVGDVGFEGTYQDDIPLALCAEIDGLFVDLPPRARERFGFIGCIPEGSLAALLDRLPAAELGTQRAWLGGIAIVAPARTPGTPPSWSGEGLGDVVVLGQRPNVTMPETVDIDLDGFVDVYDRTDAVRRPGDVTEFVLLDHDDAPGGTCRDVTGLFREQAAPPVPKVRLRGCRPEVALLAAIGAVGQSTEAGLRRRRIRAEVYAVAADDSATHVIDAVVSGTVESCEPSKLGDGLLDVTVDSDPREPLPTGCHPRLPACRSIVSVSGSGMSSRTSCAQRQAVAIFGSPRQRLLTCGHVNHRERDQVPRHPMTPLFAESIAAATRYE
jgi:hypothetical protein